MIDSETLNKTKYDQSEEAVSLRLDELKRDPEWVREMIGWYRHTIRLQDSLSGFDREFVGRPLGEDFLPGLYSERTGDPMLDKFYDVMETNPGFLNDVEILDHSRILKTNTEQRRGFGAIVDLTPNPFQVEQMQRINNQLGIELPLDNIEPYLNLGVFIEDSRVRFELLSEYYSMLQESALILKDLMPGCEEVIDSTMFNLLPVEAHSSFAEAELDIIAGVAKMSEIEILQTTVGSMEQIKSARAIMVTVIAHELSHAVVNEFLDFDSLDTELLGNALTRELTEEEISESPFVASLQKVILEGVAAALEYEVMKRMLRRLDDGGNKDDIRKYQHLRQSYLYSYEGWSVEELEENQFLSFIYHESYKVALELQKNGWRVRDLCTLLTEIKPIIKDVNTSLIEISSNPESEYQKIIGQILELKSPR